MATSNLKVTELTEVTSPINSDYHYISRSGTSKKITWANLIADVEGGGGGGAAPERVEYDPVYLKTIATNVLNEGATGDGTTNDTTAIDAAIAATVADDANLWNGYHCLHFPAGTYVVSNLTVTSGQGSNLLMFGDGDATVIKRITSDNTRFSTWTDNVHVMFRDLAFDANNVEEFAGWRMGNCHDFKMIDCHWFDSDPRGFGVVSGDRYGLYFGFHSAEDVSEDIVIRGCFYEDLQLEVDHARRVLIEHNTIARSPSTCGLGTFGVSDDCVSEDYIIRHNHIIDSKGYAIGVIKDEPSSQPYTVRRIAIYDNTIDFINTFHTAIRIGTNSTVVAQTGDIFEDIQVVGNTINYDIAGPTGTSGVAVIIFQSSATAEIRFVRTRICGNIINGNRKPNTYAISPQRLDGGLINGNTLRGVQQGIGLSRENRHVLVSYNRVNSDRAIAYHCDGATGDITFVTNTYSGNPSNLIDQTGGNTTTDGANSFETPTTSAIDGAIKASVGVATFNPGAIADAASATVDVTIQDVARGNLFLASFDQPLQGLEFKSIEYQAAHTVRVTLINRTGGSVTPASGEIRVHRR